MIFLEVSEFQNVRLSELGKSDLIPEEQGFYFARQKTLKNWHLLAVVSGRPPFLRIRTASFLSQNEFLPSADRDERGLVFGPRLVIPPPVQPGEHVARDIICHWPDHVPYTQANWQAVREEWQRRQRPDQPVMLSADEVEAIVNRANQSG